MKEKIDKAIGVITEKISKDTTAGDALRFTQAVLNLANAKGRLKDTEKD